MTVQGSATRWGPLFGRNAAVWAETWEGANSWGTPVYDHVLRRAKIGADATVLDCGCGAGRFARLAADRGAAVAGIDAAEELIRIAAERAPEGDFRVGDLEALPWADASFDLVSGFSSFQFADDKVRALTEARRVSRGPVAVTIPSRPSESGFTAVYTPLRPLFSAEALDSLRNSGIWALSDPGRLDAALRDAEIEIDEDDEIAAPAAFADLEVATRAFLGAGPTGLAIRHSGEAAVARALRESLAPFTGTGGRVTIPAWHRVVLGHAK